MLVSQLHLQIESASSIMQVVLKLLRFPGHMVGFLGLSRCFLASMLSTALADAMSKTDFSTCDVDTCGHIYL